MEFLCLTFINSRWYIGHKPFSDPFSDPSWCDDFSARWDLPAISPDMKGFAELMEYREFLYHTLQSLVKNDTMSDEALSRLNQTLRRCASRQMLTRDRDGGYALLTERREDAVSWILYQITLSFAQLLTEHPREYLRECGNPDCDWVFFDSSKNHSRKWCDQTCASLMKVRRFRQTHKEQE